MHLKEANGILSASNGMNISRGCTHGCIYCDSRSRCYQIDHDFEDVQIKSNAPFLLEDALKRKRNKCVVSTGAMSDPYINIPENLANIRSCLKIIDKYNCGIAIQTKSDLILHDLNILTSINKKANCIIQTTLTTFDEDLCKKLEPNVCGTRRRYEMLKIARENGIQTIVWLCPFLPFINDTEENLHGLLNYCVDAGVYGIIFWGIGMTLREGSRDYFYRKLDEHFSGLKDIYHKKYDYKYEIISDNSEKLVKALHAACEKHNIVYNADNLFKYMSTFAEKEKKQMELF
ncbi:MAG: radical SAM protein [Treponema sp.]|nr:radical SAM protein [Treponema sp.]